jgi:hypothetical protein
MQLSPALYPGIVSTGNVIRRQEGLRALWKGLTPFATHLCLKYALRFGTNAGFQSLLADQHGKLDDTRRVLAGLAAGVTEALVIVTPFEVRCRWGLGSADANRNVGSAYRLRRSSRVGSENPRDCDPTVHAPHAGDQDSAAEPGGPRPCHAKVQEPHRLRRADRPKRGGDWVPWWFLCVGLVGWRGAWVWLVLRELGWGGRFP